MQTKYDVIQGAIRSQFTHTANAKLALALAGTVNYQFKAHATSIMIIITIVIRPICRGRKL